MSTRRRSLRIAWSFTAMMAAAAACGRPVAPTAEGTASSATAAAPRPPPVPPAWTYWSAQDASVSVRANAPDLPVSTASITFAGNAGARWDTLSDAQREAVRTRGFVVVPRATPSARVGEAYAALRDARMPYVVTLDALFWLAHVARDRALAQAEASVLGPAMEALLRRLETHLAAEARGAPGDLAQGYAVARGVVAVGRALLSPAYVPAPELARAVAEEKRRIEAHAGPSRSPLLGVTIDYAAIVPRGAAAESAARAASARAMAWLASAPLVLGARTEVAGGEVNVGAARAQTRAALLVARLIDFDVDAEAAYAWHRLGTVAGFVGGAADDVSPRELGEMAATVGIDVRDARSLVDTAKVDRLRHALTGYRAPHVDDEGAHRVASARLLPARDAADAELLQALVFPRVGALDATVSPPWSARDGMRAMPRALDVAAWLGSEDARVFLANAHDDAYAGYDEQLRRFARRLPDEERHGSVYASSLDAIAAWLAPSAADAVQPGATGAAWRARKLEAALAAWATLRHDALAFARFPLAPASVADEEARAPDDLPAFVEPHPEAIAQLVALVRQTSLGLRTLAEMARAPAPPSILDDVARLLDDALAIARRQADDAPLAAEEHDAIATFPGRLRAIEKALAASHADEASLAVDVHVDAPSARALVEACGDLDELIALVREPQTGRLVLAAGVASSHYELAVPARDRPTDLAWRAMLHASGAPARDDFVSAFRVE